MIPQRRGVIGPCQLRYPPAARPIRHDGGQPIVTTGPSGRRMPVTLAALLRQPALGLTCSPGPGRPARDQLGARQRAGRSTPYLDGGELLLRRACGSTGRRTGGRGLRRRLVQAGGRPRVRVGVSTTRRRRSGRRGGRAGLPLVQVPEQTASSRSGRSVWEALAAEQHAEVTRTSSAQQELTRPRSPPGAPGCCAGCRAARRLGVLLDAGGPCSTRPRPCERRPLARHRAGTLPDSPPRSAPRSRRRRPDRRAVAAARRRTRGFLAVGTPTG